MPGSEQHRIARFHIQPLDVIDRDQDRRLLGRAGQKQR
jgi:hypothetical protein